MEKTEILRHTKELIPMLHFKFPYSAEEWSEKLIIENYHSHSNDSNPSTVDSPISKEDYAKHNTELGRKCLFTMEHGWQGNQFKNYDIAEKYGLKYIHGTEAYWVKDRHEADNANCHIIVHAVNAEGREDINFALSRANEDGYYYKPRLDLELLFDIPKENVIVTSACVAGWKYEDAEQIWLKIHEHFGDNFFLEVQPHNTQKQKELNKRILKLSQKTGIQLIAGMDSHYIVDDDDVRRDQLLEYKGITYPDEEGWYLDDPDGFTAMERFIEQGVLPNRDIIMALMNTNIFSSDYVKPIVLDRSFKIPTLYPNDTYEQKVKRYHNLLNEAYRAEKRKSKEKVEGIKYEAKQVVDSKVVDYFLTSHAIVKDAVENEGGVLTTTSRGSAASFYTNKLLGLTTVDRFEAEVPIYPERFLTAERVNAGSMPDIDLNITEQAPFVRASRKLLGEHGCYPLMTIGVLKEKSAWQLYATNANVDAQTVFKISKYIDAYNKALKHADDDMKDTIQLKDYIPDPYYDIFMQSKDYQSITMQLGVHACGHMLLNGDIRREVGLVSAVSESTGKRTLVAAIEGSYLDEFGYVKEDFLIVDSVGLTYELFQAINQPVPSFDDLRDMVYGDKATWDIYEKGITVAVNQCEQDATRQKVMKFKPQSLAELAQFIAAIRPGFASLLNTFLNRQEYSTGEPKIDDLLSDTTHFMIYQESIMKVLGFLGLEMGETYKVIKSISKKKLKGEKKEHLLQELRVAWQKDFGNMDNFERVWKVISDAAAYSFNAPHALSMAGDSLYAAWFKAHHTAVFYEVAIRHYQRKGKKEKVAALFKEALQFFGYVSGSYKFGDDNRLVHVDEKRHMITPNLSIIKGFGETVAEKLCELGQNKPKTFYEASLALKNVGINSTVVRKLIQIDYFDCYGDIPTLLKIQAICEGLDYGEFKQLSKKKINDLNLPVELIAQYGHETKTLYNQIDVDTLYPLLFENLNVAPLNPALKLRWESEILGVCSTTIPSANKRYYIVQDIEEKKAFSNLTLYRVADGRVNTCKVWNRSLDGVDPIGVGSLLYIRSTKKQNQREKSGEINPTTGKPKYVPIPDKFEFWLDLFSVEEEIGE